MATVEGSELLGPEVPFVRIETLLSPTGRILATIEKGSDSLFRVNVLERTSDYQLIGTFWSDREPPAIVESLAEALQLARCKLQLAEVCQHLVPILSEELNAGNAVAQVHHEAFDRCDLLLVLESGYKRSYAENANLAGLQETVERDPHYPTGWSFYCPVHQQAILAPA